MHRGYIKLYRKLLDWEWYEDANTTRLLIHVLLKANHKDKNWQGVDIKKGSFITSMPKLSKKLKLTIQQTRTSISKLISTGEITVKPTNKYSMVTVNSFNLYQQDNRQNNRRTTDEQQTDNIQTTTTNNDKEVIKNLKEVKKTPLEKKLDDFITHRKKLKKPLDEYKLSSILKKLTKLAGDDSNLKIKILQQSIDETWQGVFELRVDKPSGKKPQKNMKELYDHLTEGIEE